VIASAKKDGTSRPPILGVVLMLFVCFDCFPDEIAMPGAIVAVRGLWAMLHRWRAQGSKDEASAALAAVAAGSALSPQPCADL
jgi:hypothetical protein